MGPSAPTHSLFLLSSASHAIKGEAALIRAGVSCALIPVPRAISSQCGVCLRVGIADRERAEEVLTAGGLHISAAHDLDMTPLEKERAGERSEAEE